MAVGRPPVRHSPDRPPPNTHIPDKRPDAYNASTALGNPYLAPFFSRLIPVDVDRRKPSFPIRRYGGTTLDRALDFADRYPSARWGIRTGFKRCYSDGLRLSVIDVDALRFVQDRELLPPHLFGGCQVGTPKGLHLYVRDCRTSTKGRAFDYYPADGGRVRLVDLKASVNAYVFAPGTVRPDGQLYLPLPGFGLDLDALPRLDDGDLDALDAACGRKTSGGRRGVSFPPVSPESRNGAPPPPTLPAPAAGDVGGSDLRAAWLGGRNRGRNRFSWEAASKGSRRDTLNSVLLSTLLMPRNRERTLAETITWALYVESSFNPPRPNADVRADAKAAFEHAQDLIASGEADEVLSVLQGLRSACRTGGTAAREAYFAVLARLADGDFEAVLSERAAADGRIVDLFAQDLGKAAIARSLRVSRGKVHRVLDAGTAPGKPHDLDAALGERIANLLAKGVSKAAIARRLGVSRGKVHRALRAKRALIDTGNLRTSIKTRDQPGPPVGGRDGRNLSYMV